MTSIRLKPVSEQVIVITGASSGIGLATARTAAARGAKVVLVARNAAALAQAVRDIVGAGGEADHVVADVGVLAEVEAAAAHAVARFGRIDTWVNNAGVAIYAALLDTPMDEHERLFRTNYFGTVHGALAAVPRLRERGGALVTVASIVADIPTPVMGAYAASKHAVAGYIGSLRVELAAAKAPVSVTLVKPSGIATPVAQHAANHQQGEALIPPPVYDPQLVADAILHAAEHPRREIAVGGLGRLQALTVMHFPWLLDLAGGLFAKTMRDPARAPTPGDNLDTAGTDGRERSAVQHGRRVSLHRHAPALAAGVAALAGGWWLARRAATRR